MASIGTIQQQRAFLRRAVGHASDTALISDDLLDDCLSEALREVNLTWPIVGVGSFDTVKDQQVYDNVLPAGAYRIRRAFWPQDCEIKFPDEFSSTVDPYLLNGYWSGDVNYTFDAAAVLGIQRQQEYIRRMFEGYAKVYEPGTVYLMPVPSEDGKKVYFTFSSPRYAAAGDVEDIHGPPYYAWAKKCLHEALASGRGAVESVSSPAGVSIRTGARSSHLRLSEREHQRWLNLVPPLTTARAWP
tara:strand:+ start:3402 stop:4133 length:732 start_codon:yes stop_codon:yes gene_type:complete